ncbi:reverse transcriptase domain-containing protein [uncultured Bacteroides sp.]|jgi:RNA-directed DNA polymerase|uniref:reverse transcriptase domain-containing protein n=1 Tax=uncultured Bacteroides sp. TaxID=162156 RepID=UPI0020611336|nr:reverse transcriptase domain-containing protein [uncultured Bacteroides sp.]DAL45082.1 MAG TPA_asm: hypothetical protein [Caudoviricetes sp.]
MITLEDMYKVYYIARHNKRRSEDAVDFEVSLESNLCNLVNHINECTYRCQGNYAFISTYPQPREIFGCEMAERLVQWYILYRITPILENTLSDRLFSNRKGRGVDAAVNQVYEDIMCVSKRHTRDAYIIQWDLQRYYPDADCSIACKKLQQLVIDKYDGEDKDSLLWMIMAALHSNPQSNYYRKSGIEMWDLIPYAKSILNKPDGKGGVIGFLIWQTAMNLYLDDVDHWAVDTLGLHYTRYADDTVIVVQNKEAALTLLPLFRERYKAVGCSMHPKKFYCQHVSKGLKYLGAYIKYERLYINNRTVRRSMQRIDKFNRCRSKMKAVLELVSVFNSYSGRMKNRCEFNSIKQMWEHIDESWHEYVEMDWDRLCLVTKIPYNEIIRHKFRRIAK